jgi:hypothetical protein
VRSFTPTTGLSRMIILNLRVLLRSPGKPGMIVPILVKSIIHCNGEPHIGTANICCQRQSCLDRERVLLVRPLASNRASDLCIGGIILHLRHASGIKCAAAMQTGPHLAGPAAKMQSREPMTYASNPMYRWHKGLAQYRCNHGVYIECKISSMHVVDRLPIFEIINVSPN